MILFAFISCKEKPESDSTSVITNNEIDSNNKLQKESSLFKIAKIDTGSQRIFVVIDTNFITNTKKIRTIIEQIDKLYKFRTDLRVSFVSDVRYADYKTELDEKKGIPYHEFHKNYLGEYEKSTKIYWTYPGLADRKVKYRLN